jgi:hypothetical protein
MQENNPKKHLPEIVPITNPPLLPVQPEIIPTIEQPTPILPHPEFPIPEPEVKPEKN